MKLREGSRGWNRHGRSHRIGLYLVSWLAEIYGGDVEVGESPTGGALFRVRLPLAAD